MPSYGEGDSKASQIVTAVNKLLYGWYNNGDVLGNQCCQEWSEHGVNDLSNYANWLYEYTDLSNILDNVYSCDTFQFSDIIVGCVVSTLQD